MLTLLDINNFWSPSGGGVRRYQLEKMEHLAGRDDVHHVFVMPGDELRTEAYAPGVTIEHIPAQRLPGGGAYRQVLTTRFVRQVLDKHRPDAVECGSPWIMPLLVGRAGRRLDPAIVGFWHADFPRAYLGRGFGKVHPKLAASGEGLGWWWARRFYGRFDAIFCASRWVGDNLRRHGLDRLYHTPLGVHTERFSPELRDPERVAQLQAGDPRRVAIFFPHRFSEEKGLSCLLRAYDRLAATVTPTPALVFAGTGPGKAAVEAAAAEHPHVHYLGYLDSPEELARWYASCDLAVSLSAFETFGLSTAEAMASGLAVVAADAGSAAELVSSSECGLTVPYGDADRLAEALAHLIDEGRLRARGQRGRDYVLPLTWSATFERELEFYREIVGLHRKGQRPAPGFHGLRTPESAASARA